jgi:hypothetical protein
MIALCEIARVPELVDHGMAHTLTREEACIVRFLCFGPKAEKMEQMPEPQVPGMLDGTNHSLRFGFSTFLRHGNRPPPPPPPMPFRMHRFDEDIGPYFQVDVLQHPPKRIPTLWDVLDFHARNGH